MAIDRPSETGTHPDATVGYWLSETDAHREIFERGRQAGFREGIEAAANILQGGGTSEFGYFVDLLRGAIRTLLSPTTPAADTEGGTE